MVSLRPKSLNAILLVIISLLGFWGGVPPTAAQTEEPENRVTLEAYRALLAESRAIVERDDAFSEFIPLAERWEQITAVELTRPDGTTLELPVRHNYIVSLLRADIPNFGLLRRTFATLDDASASWPTASETLSPTQFFPDLEALNEVLARPEFQATPSEPNLFEQLRRQVLSVINEWLVWLLPQNVAWSGGNWLFTILLPAVLGIVLLLVIVLGIRRLATDLVNTTAVDNNGWQEGESLTAATAYEQAQTTSSAGDYRTAVRYLYLSTLLALDERDILRYDRAATNREYLRRVVDQPDLHTLLHDVVDVFDRVWYGFQPISRETYDTYAERVAALQQKRQRRRRPDQNGEGAKRT